MERDIPWRDTMRPVRVYVFDARLLLLASIWLFVPTWWTTVLLASAVIALRIAEGRGYRLPAAIRAIRASCAGRRRALFADRERRFVDFG